MWSPWGVRDASACWPLDPVSGVFERSEVTSMAKVSPFHSRLPGAKVYHDQSGCTVGDRIDPGDRVAGTGDLRHCVLCEALA